MLMSSSLMATIYYIYKIYLTSYNYNTHVFGLVNVRYLLMDGIDL
jgi:hypothetical protein